GLKDISSLASWTVSSAKPGNGVAALRSPDLTTFWQSDGPQPHYINIHFFKLVSIAAIRLYLDSERDESYTPTKIQFLAGMAPNDLQQFSEMDLENPMGWKQVDFSGVGPVPDDMDDDDDDDDADEEDETDWCKQPILKAFVVQVRILENHQNGKDTHLRALQVF
ncbi:galactose-binding like protein, partial [Piedraia hortae CBS 480.64]